MGREGDVSGFGINVQYILNWMKIVVVCLKSSNTYFRLDSVGMVLPKATTLLLLGFFVLFSPSPHSLPSIYLGHFVKQESFRH